MWNIIPQMGIATAIVSVTENVVVWVVVALWSLVAVCVGGILLITLRERNSEPPTYSSKDSKAPAYQQAA